LMALEEAMREAGAKAATDTRETRRQIICEGRMRGGDGERR
jgi:hypothetical protein